MAAAGCTEDFRGVFAQEEVAVSAESVGLDGARLERLGTWMESLVGAGQLPCASVCVARRGRVTYCKGVGWQEAGRAPLRDDTIYRIYSMTKPIVSVALMMLHEEGRFLLRQPAHLFLGPKWRKQNMRVMVGGTADAPQLVPCKRSITVLQLLTHTSGLSYGFVGNERFNAVDAIYQRRLRPTRAPEFSLAEFVEEVLPQLPLCFQPGERWNYSYASDVCGRLVEKLSGEPLDVFLQRRVFGPLGMRDTAFSGGLDERRRASRLAECFYEVPAAPASGGAAAAAPASGSAFGAAPRLAKASEARLQAGAFHGPSGGGGLVSTLADYWRFAQCIANGGELHGSRLLSRRTVEWMVSNHLSDGAGMADLALAGFREVTAPATGFGLGFSVVLDAARSGDMASTGSFAWGGAASTLFWVDPAEQLVVVFMTQVLGLDRLRLPLRALLANIVSGTVVDGTLHQPPALATGARSRL
eukprot:g6663.t1